MSIGYLLGLCRKFLGWDKEHVLETASIMRREFKQACRSLNPYIKFQFLVSQKRSLAVGER